MENLKTTDYETFVTISGNRSISPNKVERIKNDVNNGLNLFPYCPIIVSETDEGNMRIIDGQHRFTASKELEAPIYYVVANEIQLRDIARMNSNTDKWTNGDFMECYIELGILDYKILKNFMKKWKLTCSTGVALLLQGSPRGSGKIMSAFKDGKFSVKHSAKAISLLETVEYVMPEHDLRRDAKLLHAVQQLHEKNLWNQSRMKEKIEKHTDMMVKQSSAKNYIYTLEQIYNMGAQSRKIIF